MDDEENYSIESDTEKENQKDIIKALIILS